jgi:hypothetical protein
MVVAGECRTYNPGEKTQLSSHSLFHGLRLGPFTYRSALNKIFLKATQWRATMKTIELVRERDPSYSSDSGYDRRRRRGNDRVQRRGERDWDRATRHRSRSPRRGYGRGDIERWRKDDHCGRKRSYSPDRHRDSRDRRRDRRDYDDIYEDRPSKRRRSNSRLQSPPRQLRQRRSSSCSSSPPHRPRQSRSNSRSPIPRRSRQFRSPSPHSKRSKALLPPQEGAFRNELLRLLLEGRSRSPFPTPRSRQFRSPSPHSKRSKASLPSQEDTFRNNNLITSKWNEFYTRARAIHNKGPNGRDLKERTQEEPVDLFNDSNTTPNAIDEIFEKIGKEEPYNFPKDDDPALHAACEALSHALQEASRAEAEHDTPEIKQALGNLRRAYNEAAESNTVSMRYVDIEPPYSPFSPLKPTDSLKRTLLARSWVKELITAVRGNYIGRQILVVGQPDSGEPLNSPSPLTPPSVCIANIQVQARGLPLSDTYFSTSSLWVHALSSRRKAFPV